MRKQNYLALGVVVKIKYIHTFRALSTEEQFDTMIDKMVKCFMIAEIHLPQIGNCILG